MFRGCPEPEAMENQTMTKRKGPADIKLAPRPERITSAPAKGKKQRALKTPKELIGVDIVTALHDKTLLGHSIKDPKTFEAGFTALKALFALPPTKADIALYQQCTGRTDWPKKPFRRGLWIWGRRAGKSFLQAAAAVYLALFRDYSQYLAPREIATVFVLAADRDQARNIMRFCAGFLEAPGLKQYLAKETSEGFELTNGTVIEVATASFKSVRGYTLAGVLADEAAFWSDEDGKNPTSEIFNALAY
jgi:hypothetical protein